MRLTTINLIRILTCAVAFALTALSWSSAAQACNPFLAACRTTVPPDAPFTGPLNFLITSSGCSGFAGGGTQVPRSCFNSIQLAPGTSIQQKCLALVDQINLTCGTGLGQGNFHADGSGCANTGTFTVLDLTCNGQAANGTGVSLMLGNSVPQGSGFLLDYEQDILSNDCTGVSDSLAILDGVPTGSAINGNQSSTIFIVSTPVQGTLSTTILTTSHMTKASIVADGVSRVNLALTALNSNIRCAVDPITPALASCAIGAPADGPRIGVPVSFQVNDTGLSRFALAGPAKDIQAAKTMINTTGGVPKKLQNFNFVGGVTCSPCGGGMSGPNCCVAATAAAAAPALSRWHMALLVLLLGATGIALMRQALTRRAA